MDLGLADRAYVVTGGGAGIGWAIVDLLLREGARVATCARRGDALAAAWAGHPHADRLVLLPGDVREAADMARLVAAANDRFGRVDGVVANGGSGASGRFEETSDALLMEQLSTKILGLANTVRAALPALKTARGRVVAINGVTARVPDPEMVAVSAARAALGSLARSLAVELAPSGVGVAWIDPGPIDTPRQRARHQASGSALPYARWAEEEARRRGVLLGRLGTADEVACAACFLLSPRAAFVTGAGLEVAGGLGIGR